MLVEKVMRNLQLLQKPFSWLHGPADGDKQEAAPFQSQAVPKTEMSHLRAESPNGSVPHQTPDTLCSACASLDLRPENFLTSALPTWESQVNKSVCLGTFAEICQRKHCPICRLVVRAESVELRYFASRGRQKTPDSMTVTLYLFVTAKRWEGNSHKGRVPVFLCPGFDDGLSPLSMFAPLGVEQFFRLAGDVEAKSSLIKQWLRTCEGSHGPECQWQHQGMVRADSPKKLILVDVVNCCLVRKPSNSRYVALSYVWGRDSFFTLKKANLKQLLKPYSLRNWHKLLPRTIQDSIAIVRLTGERYLWVDSLCISQDDSRNKHDNLSAMHSIYSSAVFVIIALSGTSAGSGLFPTAEESLCNWTRLSTGMTLGSITSFVNSFELLRRDYVKEFKYMQRAWT